MGHWRLEYYFLGVLLALLCLTVDDLVPSPWGVVVGIICTVWVADGVIQFIVSRFRTLQRRREYNRWISRALHERQEKHHQVLHMKDPSHAEVVSAAETVRRIRDGRMKIGDNIVYLSKLCRKYGRSRGVNAITEELYEEAYWQATRKNSQDDNIPDSKLLLGVPMSVKDCVTIAGTYATAGLACRLQYRTPNDCLLIQLLRKHGAIPLCRGNAMQVVFHLETNNRIWGRTRNPWDLTRTCGGSSGGDAALVAMGCVPLAIGTDLGGSIRMPASVCGVVGFKPTSKRLSLKGIKAARKDGRFGTQVAVPSSIGPIARTVEDCALFMEAVCEPAMWKQDTTVPPVPFDRESYSGKTPLRIGYFASNDWFEPCSTSLRAVHETIVGLQAAGHECIPLEMPTSCQSIQELYVKLSVADGRMRLVLDALEGEAVVPEYMPFVVATHLPDFLRSLLQILFPGRRSTILALAKRNGLSASEYFELLADLVTMQRKWADDIFEAQVDALVFPSYCLPAPLHQRSHEVIMANCFLFIANLLQWPSGTVPVTVVRPDEQQYQPHRLPLGQQDGVYKAAAKMMEGSQGLPVSVSIMAPMFHDEVALRVMGEVERIANFSAFPTSYLHG